MWAYKFLLILHQGKQKKYKIPKSIKSIYQAPFLNTDHSPIDILIKLEEQSKDKTELEIFA